MTARQEGTRRGTSDAGVTLVELTVAALVSMVVLSAVAVVFTSTLSATSRASTQVTATKEARQAVDVMARRLRVGIRPTSGGPVFSEATATSMTFSASLTAPGSTADPAPSVVRYAVDPARRCLLETVTRPSTPATSTCLAFGSDTVLSFQYYRVAKRPTLDRPSPSPVPTTALPLSSTGLSATDRGLVGAVDITFAVVSGQESRQARKVSLRTRVLLANDLNEEAP